MLDMLDKLKEKYTIFSRTGDDTAFKKYGIECSSG